MHVPENCRIARNIILACDFMMSHILHFYHLVALDYVDLVQGGGGLIPKGFLCPTYSNVPPNVYYARGIDPGLGAGGAVYTVNDRVTNVIPRGAPYLGDLTPYLAGQYVRALKFRRMAHQLGAMWAGKMPNASCYTPGCVTTKTYDPNPLGADAAVVQKFEELMFGGPNWAPGSQVAHPLGAVEPPGAPNPGNPNISPYNPHPESILGFIGKPWDFWKWAGGGFNPADLPVWAQVGVPAAGVWKEYTGTHLFDVVAAAHLFPEYFWVGQGHGRFLAYGAYEKGGPEGGPYFYADQRLIHRSRTHVRRSPVGDPAPLLNVWWHPVDPKDQTKINEFVDYSWYNDTPGLGRHPWRGRTAPNPNKLGPPTPYTYAKTPRYLNVDSVHPDDELQHPNGQYLPYEVGPLARMMANAFNLPIPITPVLLVANAGDRMGYYPGILADVDAGLAGLGVVPAPIGILPAYGTPPPATVPFPGPTVIAGISLYGDIPDLSPAGYNYPSNYYGDSTLDRIAARALECYYVARHVVWWFQALNPALDAPKDYCNYTQTFRWPSFPGRKYVPKKSKGYGCTEAPRGALGHWIKIGKGNNINWYGQTRKYQIITPTAWNVSPLDQWGQHGPIEQCLANTPVANTGEPVEIMRVVHSFDCCLACTVHVLEHKNGKKVKVAKVLTRTGTGLQNCACEIGKKQEKGRLG